MPAPKLRRLTRPLFTLLGNNLDRLMSFYPPYLGAGVKVAQISDDYRYVRVEMPLRVYNQNFVGTHFGGSLFAMCDPFYMIMLMKNLGPEYIVWDKSATIRFKKPGRGTVVAEFQLTEDEIEALRRDARQSYKVEPVFTVEVRDKHGDVVAEIDKTIYIRRKS